MEFPLTSSLAFLLLAEESVDLVDFSYRPPKGSGRFQPCLLIPPLMVVFVNWV
jgi:hypothetical protein